MFDAIDNHKILETLMRFIVDSNRFNRHILWPFITFVFNHIEKSH